MRGSAVFREGCRLFLNIRTLVTELIRLRRSLGADGLLQQIIKLAHGVRHRLPLAIGHRA